MFMRVDRHKNNKLIQSYIDNDLPKFIKLIKDGANVNCVDDYGVSLIAKVLSRQKFNVDPKGYFDALIDAGVYLGKIGRESPLTWYSIYHYEDTYYLKKLLDNNIDVNLRGHCNLLSKPCGPPIIDTLSHDRLKHFKLLLKYNPNLEICDSDGDGLLCTFLSAAYYYSHPRTIHGDPKKINKRYKDLFKKLIKKGVDPNERGDGGRQPIHYIVQRCMGDLELLDYLFQSNIEIEINARDTQGNTALMSAVETWKTDVVDFLINKNARLNICNTNGHSASAIAAISYNHRIFDLLSKSGDDYLSIDFNGNNILHHLHKFETDEYYYETILKKSPELLLMKNNLGKTPYDLFNKQKGKNLPLFNKFLKQQERS